LEGISLLDPACKVDFVITVQALNEGWDCSFAYVFCSLATLHSKKDVEQLLGRVLPIIDVQGKRLVEKYLGSQAAFGFEDVPTNVTDLALSRQLEKALRQQGIRPEVLLEFIRKTVGWLVSSRKLSLATLLHVRFALEKALREKIEACRQKAYNSGYQLRLFGESAAVETSYKYAFIFDPDNYRATAFYHRAFKFPKHYYGEDFVGEFDGKEELECAKEIEKHPLVKRWVRNVVGMFGLPTATGTFYPDFFAELNDGRVLLVEYKGEHLIEHEQQKKNIGERWAETSGGKALFLWAVKKDEHGRDVHRQLQDKLAKA
jgi:type III restriction enzyme